MTYELAAVAWGNFDAFLRELIVKHRLRRICEIGGGANPALPREFVEAHQLDYLIADISLVELAKAPAGYRTLVLDITGETVPTECCDLVFSKMLAEHVQNAAHFHGNVLRMLGPGGVAFHFFPTLFAPPFVLNHLVPETLTRNLLHWLQPYRKQMANKLKFPAHYAWCRGPSEKQMTRFQALGYNVLAYTGFFGHGGYYRKFPPLRWAHEKFCKWLCRHPTPLLTSFAYVVLQKPREDGRYASASAILSKAKDLADDAQLG